MRVTLGAVVWLFLAVLAVVCGVSYRQTSQRATERVKETGVRLRRSAVERAVGSVTGYLGKGERAMANLQKAFAAGGCEGAAAIESCLVTELIQDPDITEVGFTHGDGEVWQSSVYRSSDGAICTRRVHACVKEDCKADVACRPAHELLLPANAAHESGKNPALAPGYISPAERVGQVLRSDLTYSQLDALLPEPKRRVVVLTLQGIAGRVPGVLRVGLLARDLWDVVAAVKVNPDPVDPYRLFISDPKGQLITGLSADDGLFETPDEDLRIAAKALPPEVAAALKRVKPEPELTEEAFDLDGRTYVVGFQQLPDTQGWRVGVVGPEDYYTKELTEELRKVLLGMLGIMGAIGLGALLTLQAMRRALRRIETETGRMRRFEFGPVKPTSPFSDVRDALQSLEQGKTAMRALSRFVPVALVRRLFDANEEPELGSEPREVSMMFTDIEGFTTLVEKEEPAALARWLGDYFAVMTAAVHKESGIVDKFIGDAVMALWNAPGADPDHAVHACAAALGCLADTEGLYATEYWRNRPRLITRFGIHLAEVRVGHFGAPDRISYTAIGDGVNLASRLEGLNKQYGTRILVSDAVEARARHAFAFRRIDRVAVKGKSKSVEVFELLGRLDAPAVAAETCARYDQAWAHYAARDFAKACEALAAQLADPPSAALHRRCVALVERPPPADWDGTLHAETK